MTTGGSLTDAGGLLLVASAPNLPVFFVTWSIAGTAMAATFYQPAFTALTRWHPLNTFAP
ncbi:hypothetical protein [Kitasatospora purpeofusca]|uniref:hypothetical protein n=1 Tax=Kitasatospora purpeofusca TaxID=67352 RepID=UPI003F4AAE15